MQDVLHVTGVVKRYDNVTALKGADFQLRAGEVHVLLGANGSGKSTMSKIVVGTVRPDTGRIVLDSGPYDPHGPQDARRQGIAVVYQELSLVPTLTVSQNIHLGLHGARALFQHRDEMNSRTDGLLRQFQGVIDASRCRADAFAGDLPSDEQQIVEILKALALQPRILILDEATASLHGNQVERLFQIVSTMKAAGCAVVFISHRMEEVFRIGDRATVLRNGETVGTFPLPDTPRQELLAAMVGSSVAKSTVAGVGAQRVESMTQQQNALEVENLCAPGVAGVSFSVRKGEVLGLSGLQGQGQSELLLAIFGASEMTAGAVHINGTAVRLRHPAEAVRNGVAYVTGDRKGMGIFPSRSILENIVLSGLRQRRSEIFAVRTLTNWVNGVVERLSIVCSGLRARIVELSGGNQQKVIIGRGLLIEPRVLLMDDPTKGVDIKTKNELYDLVAQMCETGMAVIWNSSEDRELLDAAHRVLVLREGRVAAELKGDKLNAYELYNAAL